MEISQSESTDKTNTGKCKQMHMDILQEILKNLRWLFLYSFLSSSCSKVAYEPRQANLCLRAFRHDKF